MSENLVYRILVGIVGVLFTAYVAFVETPELDNVRNRNMYRLSFMMLLLRGWTFTWFVLLGIFPLE